VGGPQHGDTPLHAAAQRGHTAIVELLKAAEAKVLRGGPLHVAAEDGDKATVEELLAAAGVDVNVQKNVRKFLSPCLPRVWVYVDTVRGTVEDEAVRWYAAHTALTDGVGGCCRVGRLRFTWRPTTDTLRSWRHW
jgi:ankyrin repeat protein